MDRKLISVIIPTYGRPTHLKRAIDSVIKQSYTNWELIVVDDNDPSSSDREKTERIISSVTDSRIKYVKHPYNKNGAAARNTGIIEARGEIITFLDDDDEYVTNRFQRCLDELLKEENKKYAGVYTGCIFYKNDTYYRSIKTAATGNFLVEALATTFKSHSGSNIFVRKEIISDLGGFDETFERHQDYEFFVRLFEKYDLLGIPELLLIKHENGANIPNIDKLYRTKMQYLQKYKYLIDKCLPKEANYIYSAHFIQLAIYAANQDLEKAKYYYEKADKYQTISLRNKLRYWVICIRGRINEKNRNTNLS